MPKSKKPRQAPYSSALQKWEDAGKKLATALTSYHQSCIFLGTFSGPRNPDTDIIASRIDHSLNTLHTRLSDELSQSRAVLAKMRNKISSGSYTLPDEVLGEIFGHVVCTPSPGDELFPSMTKGLKRIFGRLHRLLAVCSTWRNLGISLRDLWSVIPAGDDNSSWPTPAATSLAFQRSQALTSSNRRLHLAVILSDQFALAPPLTRNKIPQFHSINIESQYESSTHEISDLLEDLLASQSPTGLSELSIHQYQDEVKDTLRHVPFPEDYVDCLMSPKSRGAFADLIGSLSVLRLRSTIIRWNTINFSDKLVEIHLQSLVLGDHSKLNEFLSVIESASELCDIKLVSVMAFAGESPPPKRISLPKLQSLLLDDLEFDVLQHVLTSIAPGSHRLKVGLTPKSNRTRHLDDESDDEFNDEFGEEWGNEAVFNLLNHSNIDTLFLDAGCYNISCVRRGELRSLLRSLPGLKTLVMDSWNWDSKDILALKRPDSTTFSNLTGLYIFGGYMCDPHLLPRVVASYTLQTLVLGCTLEGKDTERVVPTLKKAVPHFRLIKDEEMDDFDRGKWRLGSL